MTILDYAYLLGETFMHNRNTFSDDKVFFIDVDTFGE